MNLKKCLQTQLEIHFLVFDEGCLISYAAYKFNLIPSSLNNEDRNVDIQV